MSRGNVYSIRCICSNRLLRRPPWCYGRFAGPRRVVLPALSLGGNQDGLRELHGASRRAPAHRRQQQPSDAAQRRGQGRQPADAYPFFEGRPADGERRAPDLGLQARGRAGGAGAGLVVEGTERARFKERADL